METVQDLHAVMLRSGQLLTANDMPILFPTRAKASKLAKKVGGIPWKVIVAIHGTLEEVIQYCEKDRDKRPSDYPFGGAVTSKELRKKRKPLFSE